MRNLKKILALVLALVMSLSLMATAGAKDFADKSDIDATGYQTAVDVLAELEIIRGYADGSFQPNGDITRAEVAAIVYRIATKDVGDAQASIYTSWNKFADVKDGAWYAGYVNYCANAGIVKGTSATTFEPENKVTGYQVLAMILRTMGYGKNGEFEGGNWAINTAAQAKQIGILDNIVNEQLGSPATRAMVAEILFQAMLTETVDYNAITGYQPNGKTLGQTQFGLEEIAGVVMANEYADLENENTLSAGKTRLNVDGKDYILNVTTDLTDIGESRAAYVKKASQTSFDLLGDKLYDTGLNVCAESGDEQASIKSFAKSEAGLDITGAQHFRNFGYDTVGKSEWRIEYRVEFDNSKTVVVGKDKDGNPVTQTAQKWFESEYSVTLNKVFGVKKYDADGTPIPANERLDTIVLKDDDKVQYTRIIPVGDEITVEDITVMQGIFSVANDYSDSTNGTKLGVGGYVYAGTAKVVDQHDLSSEMTWNAFRDKYIDSRTDTAITDNENGQWLKVVDNDGDGVAEYVFKTVYCAEKVLSKNTKYDYFSFGYVDENDKLQSHIDVNPNSKTGLPVNYIDEVEVGDIVLAAKIDNKWQIEKAPEDIKVIKTVNYREETVTTTEEDVYDQSAIAAHHGEDYDILEMGEKVEYTVYFDHFGHVVAYTTEAAETNYALLSELYYSNDRNGKYLTNTDVVVEITMGDAKTAEKVATNTSSKAAGAPWFEGIKDADSKWPDYLQRAINHLGTHKTDASKDATKDTPAYKGAEFAYPTKTTETNVAVYTYDEENDTVAIYPAAQYAYNRAGEQLFYSEYDEDGNLKVIDPDSDNLKLRSWTAEKITLDEYVDRYNAAKGTHYTKTYDVSKDKNAMPWSVRKPVYAVDYVKLDVSKSIGSSQVRYDMDELDASYDEYGMHEDYAGNYVNATHETEYYVVSRDFETDNNAISGISYYKGYENLPKYAKEDIYAMYAVATNTTRAQDAANYWVADVIVIEASAVVANYDSVALAYFNPVKSTGTTRHLDALDNMTNDPQVDLVPKKEGWDGYWLKYGFYALYDTEVSEPSVAAGKIVKIEEKFNSYGIHAGTVFRSAAVYAKGDYVMVDKGDGVQKELYVGNVPVYGITDEKDSSNWDIYELTTANLKTGDQIIYVYNKAGTLKYIVVANFDATNYGEPANWYWNNDWTENLWQDIIDDQNPEYTGKIYNLKLNLTKGEKATVTCGDYTKTIKGNVDGLAEYELPIHVPNALKFTFTLAVSDPMAALVPDAPFKFVINPTDEKNVWSVTAYNSEEVKVLSEDDEDKAGPTVIGSGASYTVKAVQTIIEEAKKPVGVEGGNSAVTALRLADTLKSLVDILFDDVAEDLQPTVTTGIVAANVNVVVAEYNKNNPDNQLTDEQIEKITEAVTAAVEKAAAEAAEGAAEEVTVEIGAIIDKVVEDAINDAVDATLAGVDPTDEDAAEKTALANAKTALSDAIDTAKAALAAELPEGVTDETEGVEDAQAALTKAIDTAKAALDAADATADTLTAAKKTLDAAVKTYEDAIAALAEGGDEPGPDEPGITNKYAVTFDAATGIEITGVESDGKAIDKTDEVYKIEADADLTIVLTITSEDEIADDATIVLVAGDAEIVATKVEVGETDKTTATVTFKVPKPTAAVTYTVTIKAASAG